MKEKEEKPRESRIQKREMKSFEIESREDKREYIWKAKEYRKGKVKKSQMIKNSYFTSLSFLNLSSKELNLFWRLQRIYQIRNMKVNSCQVQIISWIYY
jgi:hypothetical protein